MKYILGIIMAVVGVVNMAGATSFTDRLTQDDQRVVVTNDINDPLRNGAHNPGASVDGLYYQGPITNFLQAENQTLAFIQRMVNRFLSVLGFIALVYLLYHGFLMVTANGDDAQFKKGVKSMRTAVIAIIGIAVSAFVINFIFYVLDQLE